MIYMYVFTVEFVFINQWAFALSCRCFRSGERTFFFLASFVRAWKWIGRFFVPAEPGGWPCFGFWKCRDVRRAGLRKEMTRRDFFVFRLYDRMIRPEFAFRRWSSLEEFTGSALAMTAPAGSSLSALSFAQSFHSNRRWPSDSFLIRSSNARLLVISIRTAVSAGLPSGPSRATSCMQGNFPQIPYLTPRHVPPGSVASDFSRSTVPDGELS